MQVFLGEEDSVEYDLSEEDGLSFSSEESSREYTSEESSDFSSIYDRNSEEGSGSFYSASEENGYDVESEAEESVLLSEGVE